MIQRQKNPKKTGARFEVLSRGHHIDIRRRSKRIAVSDAAIRQAVCHVLKAEGVKHAHLSIQLVSDPFISKLNKLFKRRSRPTDVLSFDVSGGRSRDFVFADVVVSADTARRTAVRMGLDPVEEVCRYTIHGLLHLVGFNDETPAGRQKMWRRQEKLLRDILKHKQ
ncbi:MAG: rRNA maturation RNase YbeY [Candidatus Omnitrophica bacterium]|nr:rRNA maturation RNase YbeY [Candidatus Omnitrophota bacterium]MDD5574914.1 rRNA maturation RNase YbeY [Candidatus Omnitrophota bacterium]